VSQESKDKSNTAETRTQETRSYVREVRRATRKKYTSEEKTRIVLEGFRREVIVRELCRREGIKPGAFYAWTKEFMEVGKERLARDTVRDATREEIWRLKRESRDLKELVAELSLEVHTSSIKRPFHPSQTTVRAHECFGESCCTGLGRRLPGI